MTFLEIALYVLFSCAVLLVGYCSYIYAGLRGTDRTSNGRSDSFFLWAIAGGVFGGSTLFTGLDLGWSPFFIVLGTGVVCFAAGAVVRRGRTS